MRRNLLHQLFISLFLCALCFAAPSFMGSSNSVQSQSFYDYFSDDHNSRIDPNNIDLDLLEELVHAEVNKLRARKRLSKLKRDPLLLRAADMQNNYCLKKGTLTHRQPSSSKRAHGDRIRYLGGDYSYTGENLQYIGFTTYTRGNRVWYDTGTYEEMAKDIVKNWIQSKGHYANLVNPNYDLVGTALAYDEDKAWVYCSQVYGKL